MLVVVVLLAGLFGVRLFLFPATDPITTADAVVVFTDADDTGVDDAIGLVDGGAAGALVVLGGDGGGGPTARQLCAGGAAVEVVCPAGSTGREQARAAGAVITERGWRTVALVGGRATLSRQSLLLSRCTDASLLRRADTADTAGGAAGATFVEAPRYFVALFLRQGC